MDVEELRILAKSMGYNIIPIKKYEKLLPCVCGCNRRSHWDTVVRGIYRKTLRCENCEREASGRTEAEVRHNWNEMIRSEQDGCSNIKGKDKI